jgi:putative cell wall-binding protein
VSDTVIQQLKTVQSNVRRDAGTDRYSTAATIVDRAFPSAKQAYIATGANFPDALSGSAAAASSGVPVILVPSSGSTSPLPSETRALLQRLGVTKVTILGGTGVVSSRIQSDLGALLGTSNVTRIGGADRFATSTAINKAAFGAAAPVEVFFATGYGFADALSGGALAGKTGSPLYLVYPHCVPAAVLKDMKAMGVKKVTLLGGTGVLNSGLSRLPSC